MKKNIYLTFDIEDWFQVENMRSVFPPESWDRQELHIEENIEKILFLLDKYNIKATFFVLGWIAERKPKLIRRIYKKGHEIASHGYGHLLNYNLSSEELTNDIKKSKEILEDIIGERVIGYRAPSFSITDDLLQILYNLGFKYDSSYNAFSFHDRYGKILVPNNSYSPFKHISGITEVPMPLVKMLGLSLPISGGGYFRIYPYKMFELLVNKYFRTNCEYVFYMHPWEFDTGQPKIKTIPINYRIRHYSGIKRSYDKLDKFIYRHKNYNFCTIRSIVG